MASAVIAGFLAALAAGARADNLDLDIFAVYGDGSIVTVGNNVTIQGGVLGSGSYVSAGSGLVALSGVFSGGGFYDGGDSTLGPVVVNGTNPPSLPAPSSRDGFGPGVVTGGISLPGYYEDVTVPDNSVLRLVSGNYLFQSFTAGDNLLIEIDLTSLEHSIDVIFANSANFGSATTVQVTGGSFESIHWETGGPWTMFNQSHWLGTILARALTNEDPSASINIGNDNHIQGALYSDGSISMGDYNTVSIGPDQQTGGAIPEPLTIAGFVLSAAVVLRHIRKKARKQSLAC